jgi:thioredoxin-related protein
MMRKRQLIRAALLGLVFAAGGAVRADAPEGYDFVAFDEGMRRAQAEDRPVFVYFGRYGCGFCEKTNKEAFSDPRVRERYSANYVLVYVDAESGRRLRLPSGERITERELGTRYSAFVTPVFTFLTPRGEAVGQRIGVQSADDLLTADAAARQALRAGIAP